MGKRKYEADDTNTQKKTKTIDFDVEKDIETEQPQNETNNKHDKHSTKSGSFDIKHFRKELAAKQGQNMGKYIYTFIVFT